MAAAAGYRVPNMPAGALSGDERSGGHARTARERLANGQSGTVAGVTVGTLGTWTRFDLARIKHERPVPRFGATGLSFLFRRFPGFRNSTGTQTGSGGWSPDPRYGRRCS